MTFVFTVYGHALVVYYRGWISNRHVTVHSENKPPLANSARCIDVYLTAEIAIESHPPRPHAPRSHVCADRSTGYLKQPLAEQTVSYFTTKSHVT